MYDGRSPELVTEHCDSLIVPSKHFPLGGVGGAFPLCLDFYVIWERRVAVKCHVGFNALMSFIYRCGELLVNVFIEGPRGMEKWWVWKHSSRVLPTCRVALSFLNI